MSVLVDKSEWHFKKSYRLALILLQLIICLYFCPLVAGYVFIKAYFGYNRKIAFLIGLLGINAYVWIQPVFLIAVLACTPLLVTAILSVLLSSAKDFNKVLFATFFISVGLFFGIVSGMCIYEKINLLQYCQQFQTMLITKLEAFMALLAEHQSGELQAFTNYLKELDVKVFAFACFGLLCESILLFIWLMALIVTRLYHHALPLTIIDIQNWSLPEWFVWPFILCASLFVFGQSTVKILGWHSMKVFVTVYALQGFSILAVFFEVTKAARWLRALGYSFGFFFFMYFLGMIGLFDQWINFRVRFKKLKSF